MSLPRSLAEALEAAVEREGGSRSGLIQEALEQYLWLTQWRELQAYGVVQSTALGLSANEVERLIDELRTTDESTTRRR